MACAERVEVVREASMAPRETVKTNLFSMVVISLNFVSERLGSACSLTRAHVQLKIAQDLSALLNAAAGAIEGHHQFHVLQSLHTRRLGVLVPQNALCQMVGLRHELGGISVRVRLVHRRLTLY